MRNSTRFVAMAMAMGALATAVSAGAPDVKPAPKPAPAQLRCCKTRMLDGEADLNRLAESNPRHYAIVRRIVDAAGEICKASAPTATFLTKFDAQELACRKSFWLTSYPPKRELFFRIEDTSYFVRVSVPDTGGHLEPADQRAGVNRSPRSAR